MNENIFQQIDSNNKAYWLGFLAADGSVKGNELSIGLSSKDRGHLAKFLAFINSNNPVIDTMSHCTNNDKYYPSSHINLYSNKLVNDLSLYGIVNSKSFQDIDFLEKVPKKYYDAFIIGYFDGDGWFTCTEKSHGYGFCGNKKTMTKIRDLLFEKFQYNMSVLQYNKSPRTFYIEGQSKVRIKQFSEFYLSFEASCDLLERKKDVAKKLIDLCSSRKQIKTQKYFKICPYCKKEFYPTHSEQKYCSYECSAKGQQKVDRPEREELKQLIRTTSFLEIGRQFGVSDNAVRKWCDRYNLPRKATEIKKFSDIEWNKI